MRWDIETLDTTGTLIIKLNDHEVIEMNRKNIANIKLGMEKTTWNSYFQSILVPFLYFFLQICKSSFPQLLAHSTT